MRVLLTGGSGFIGRNLSRHLITEGHTVFCLCRESSIFDFHHTNLHRVPIRDYSEIATKMEEIRPDGVIHLATRFESAHAPEHITDLIYSNIEYGAYLIEAACRYQVPWFLNTGTFWQHYEGACYLPVNFYAATKQAFEDIARYYYSLGKILFVTLCLNDTYGPGDTRRKIFNLWKKISKTGETLAMSPGEQIMDMIYIDDVVSAFLLLCTRLETGQVKNNGKIYYLSAREKYSLRELAQLFETVSGKKLPIIWGKLPYRPRETMYPRCYGEPLPDWNQKVNFQEGIQYFLRGKNGRKS